MLFNTLAEIEAFCKVEPYLNRHIASRLTEEGILERAEIWKCPDGMYRLGRWSELFGLVNLDA